MRTGQRIPGPAIKRGPARGQNPPGATLGNTRLNPIKAGVVAAIALYGVLCAASPSTYRFLDYVNLVFHEAGHVMGNLNLLRWDQAAGNLVHLLGVVALIASVVGGLYFSVEDRSE